jgi:hypothetical protein
LVNLTGVKVEAVQQEGHDVLSDHAWAFAALAALATCSALL